MARAVWGVYGPIDQLFDQLLQFDQLNDADLVGSSNCENWSKSWYFSKKYIVIMRIIQYIL